MGGKRVVLSGGPDQLTAIEPVHEVRSLGDTVKVEFAGGREHFANSGEVQLVGGECLPLFRWCGRTKIAE